MRARAQAPVAALRGRQRVLALAALAAVVVATPVSASSPAVHIEPVGPLPVGTHTLTVTGSGFDPAGNHGNGIYVVFGPISPAPAYYLDPRIYAAFKWVHPAGQESGAESPMAADGSFSTTLVVPSSFTGPQGSIDCTAMPCAVITFGAHGSQDRSQDTCAALTFLPPTSASPAPAASMPAGAVAQPSAEVAPTAPALPPEPAVSPVPGDPCGAIAAAPGI